MKKLLRYMRPYKKQAVLGPLFKLLEASFELIVPLIVASIINVGVANADRPYIYKMCGVLVALGVIGLICSITAQYFAAKTAVGFSAKLRSAVFAKVQGLSFSQLDGLGTSTIITRMTSDINQIQSGVNLTLRLFLRSPFVVFGAMIMAFTVDVRSALVFAGVIPVLCVVVFGIMLVSIPLYKKVQEKLGKVLRITRENLTGVRVLRAFCKEDAEIAQFDRSNGDLSAEQRYVGGISALMSPLTYVIINVAIIALIYTGALQVQAGILTQGAVVALYNYMSQILVELIKLANLIINITKAIACGNRVQSVLELPEQACPKTEVKPADTNEILRFDHVHVSYSKEGGEALHDISFCVKAGQTVGVIGGTGSGKTTLAGIIAGFYPTSSGSVQLMGRPLCEYPAQQLRRLVGIVMQKAVLFKGTIRQNLQMGNPGVTDAALLSAAQIAQAGDVLAAKAGDPDDPAAGLDAPVEQGGRNFSGGQRQRLSIARTLARKPEILILDDSASALDYATDLALRRAIRAMQPSPTVFIISQRTASVQYADRILVLDDGELCGTGTHEQLLETCPVYKEIYDSQYSAPSTNGKEVLA